MKKIVILYFLCMSSLMLKADNMLEVHLGGLVQGGAPNVSLTDVNWTANENQARQGGSEFDTQMTIKDGDTRNSEPVVLVLGVGGNLGEYSLNVDANGKTQQIDSQYGDIPLKSLGAFYGSPLGTTYPVTMIMHQNNPAQNTSAQFVFTAYYQS